MEIEIIDLEKWDRKTPYENFVSYSDPTFAMTVKLDVSKVYKYSKKTKSSLFINCLYAVNRTLNAIPDFRLRISDGKVVRFAKIDPSFIVLNDAGVIQTASVTANDNYEEFYGAVKNKIESVRKGENQAKFNQTGQVGLFYYTAIKWVDFSHMKNPYHYPDGQSTSIPRIAWGKVVKEGRKYKMSLDISCHHALLDGYPMSQAFNNIQKAFNDFEKFIKE